jgi:hypothetical protein
MEWLDAHAGSVQAVATLVLLLLTGYYAWFTRGLVRETHASLQATARTTLQGRLDRISELLIEHPDVSRGLDEPDGADDVRDGRFHIAGMLVAVLEEAHTQYMIEHTMPDEDWNAWVVTIDRLIRRPYLLTHWRAVAPMYGESFRRFVDERLQQPAETPA